MANYIGKLVNIGVGSESTRGAGASEFDFIPKLSFSFDEKVEVEENTASIGKLTNTTDSCVSKIYGEGEIEGHLGVNIMGYFFKNILGEVVSEETASGSGAYKHTFNLAHNNLHPSLAVALVEPNQNVVFPLAMLENIELTGEPGKCLTFKAGFKSKQETNASNTANYNQDNLLNANHISVKIADDESGLDTGTNLDLLNFNLKIETSLEDIVSIGSNEVKEIFNQAVVISGSFELLYNDNEFKEIFKNQDKKALGIYIENTGTTIGTNGDHPKLQIILPKVFLEEWARNIDEDSVIQQTLGFKALYDVANDKLVSLELINTKSAY